MSKLLHMTLLCWPWHKVNDKTWILHHIDGDFLYSIFRIRPCTYGIYHFEGPMIINGHHLRFNSLPEAMREVEERCNAKIVKKKLMPFL